MVTIENVEVSGFDAAIRGMRNPLNSWDKSDSIKLDCGYLMGPSDLVLCKKLAKAGRSHSKFKRFITVTMDITAPLFWWKEFDTYKVGTVANSQSTMHTVTNKEFDISDFSVEQLYGKGSAANNLINYTIDILNTYREQYLNATNSEEKKKLWWQIIQLLPSSYNQKRTVLVNYQVLTDIWNDRRNHKLGEGYWNVLIDEIECMPYSELITGEEITNAD